MVVCWPDHYRCGEEQERNAFLLFDRNRNRTAFCIIGYLLLLQVPRTMCSFSINSDYGLHTLALIIPVCLHTIKQRDLQFTSWDYVQSLLACDLPSPARSRSVRMINIQTVEQHEREEPGNPADIRHRLALPSASAQCTQHMPSWAWLAWDAAGLTDAVRFMDTDGPPHRRCFAIRSQSLQFNWIYPQLLGPVYCIRSRFLWWPNSPTECDPWEN